MKNNNPLTKVCFLRNLSDISTDRCLMIHNIELSGTSVVARSEWLWNPAFDWYLISQKMIWRPCLILTDRNRNITCYTRGLLSAFWGVTDKNYPFWELSESPEMAFENQFHSNWVPWLHCVVRFRGRGTQKNEPIWTYFIHTRTLLGCALRYSGNGR